MDQNWNLLSCSLLLVCICLCWSVGVDFYSKPFKYDLAASEKSARIWKVYSGLKANLIYLITACGNVWQDFSGNIPDTQSNMSIMNLKLLLSHLRLNKIWKVSMTLRFVFFFMRTTRERKWRIIVVFDCQCQIDVCCQVVPTVNNKMDLLLRLFAGFVVYLHRLRVRIFGSEFFAQDDISVGWKKMLDVFEANLRRQIRHYDFWCCTARKQKNTD